MKFYKCTVEYIFKAENDETALKESARWIVNDIEGSDLQITEADYNELTKEELSTLTEKEKKILYEGWLSGF